MGDHQVVPVDGQIRTLSPVRVKHGLAASVRSPPGRSSQRAPDAVLDGERAVEGTPQPPPAPRPEVAQPGWAVTNVAVTSGRNRGAVG
jgi:hypothetical protein